MEQYQVGHSLTQVMFHGTISGWS